MPFLRFTIPSDGCRTQQGVASGIFHATYRLVRNGRFEEGERLWWEEEMTWFEKFLPATQTLRDRRAVCWFRPDAGEALSRMWRMVTLVEREGIPVRVYHSRRPGHVIYTDALQIAAVPYRDSFEGPGADRQRTPSSKRPRLRRVCASGHDRNRGARSNSQSQAQTMV